MQIVNIHNNDRKVYLFKRDLDGNLTIDTDETFFPYYYEIGDGDCIGYDGRPLKRMFVTSPRDIRQYRSSSAYEGDIVFTRRYMVDKVKELTKPGIKYAFIDIEILTKVIPNVKYAKFPVSVISIYNSANKKIITFRLDKAKSEYEMIDDFINYMKKEKFDLWLSWNVKFDYNYLFNRFPNFAKKISIINQDRWIPNEDVTYPAGISIVDYMEWFKKVTLNKMSSYALDSVAEEVLGHGKVYKEVDFSKITEDLVERNREDVALMQRLEEKKGIIQYFDEVRRLSKVEWEDLMWNSRIIDMLILQEAKVQNVVLPMKPTDNEKEDFEGAYREAYELGAHFNIGKYDLASAYPNMIIDFCLDPSNIKFSKGDNTLTIEGTEFEQNENALLPTICKRLLTLKGQIGAKKKSLSVDDPDYANVVQQYNAIKTIVNSAYGVMGNRFFRLYDKSVASATTFLVREVLHYVRDRIEAEGYRVIYVDTDSVFLNTDEDLTDKLNGYLLDWIAKYNKPEISTSFDCEGVFTKLLILAKCLDPRTKILTEDGYKTISNMFRTKYDGKIWSYNELMQVFELKRIHGYMRSPLYNRKLFKVILDTKKNDKRNYGAIVTEDHEILTEDGYKQIKELNKNDKINSGTYLPSKDIYSVIIGTLLGDSSITKANFFSCSHSIKQEEYLDYKFNLIADNFHKKQSKCKVKGKDYTYIKGYFNELYLRKLRKQLYFKNKKVITSQILKDYNIISLAFQYMDDGYLRQSKYYASEIATCGFDKISLIALSEKIKKLGLDHSITKDNRLYFTVEQTKKLSEAIAPYIPKCMEYKILPEHRNKEKYTYNHLRRIFFDNFSLKEYKPKQKSVYDIGIEDNHNFITQSGVVHNCRYMAELKKPNGEIEPETKGVEAKRKDSTKFMKVFQKELIDKILNKEPKQEIFNWIRSEVSRLQTLPLEDIAFPCKLSKPESDYKNVPIFVRAVNETEGFSPKLGEHFYYIYVDPEEYYITKKVEEYFRLVPGKRAGTTKKERITKTKLKEFGKNIPSDIQCETKTQKIKKYKDVKAFNLETSSSIKNVDWHKMTQRNIYMKLETIFSAMGWNIEEVM